MMRGPANWWAGLRLRGQITVLLGAAAALIAITAVLVEALALERRAFRQQHMIAQEFAQTAFSVLQSVPPEARPELAANLSGPHRAVSVGQPQPLITRDMRDTQSATLMHSLREAGHDWVQVHIARSSRRNDASAEADRNHPIVIEVHASMRGPQDDGWIIATTRFTPTSTRLPIVATLAAQTLITLTVLSLVLILLRRLTAPVDRLARAANHLSHGGQVDPLTEAGSADLRSMIRMFNRMALSLSQTIAYQKTLLQSLGHDLKSPLRDARRSVRGIADPEARAALSNRLSALENQLASITSFTLATLRDGDVERIAIGALLEALAEEAEERDQPVTLTLSDHQILLNGRHHALSRAFRNLIENAVRYGGNAAISLHAGTDTVDIRIDDNGPGVAEEDLDSLMRPFVRLATDTQGSGLGLAIARTVIMDHGGTLTLTNRPEGGLRQTVCLPLAQA